MGFIDFNVTAQLESIERRRREAENKFYEEEISIYNKVLNFKINFGKHNGKTIKEIIDVDKQYVYWLLSKTFRTGFKINLLELNRIVDYHINTRKLEQHIKEEEEEYKNSQVEYLMKEGMSYHVAHDCIYNRNCRDFGM